jgi:hypothetical protein
MSDFTTIEFSDPLSHETKFFLISERLLHAKGHSRQPSDSITHIPLLDSNITLTSNTGNYCCSGVQKGGGEGRGEYLFSRVNEFLDDVHRGGTGKFLDHFQPATNGVPRHLGTAHI